jgi:hypothetical protein
MSAVYLDFSEAQQALWDAANSSLPYSVSRFAMDELRLECHKPRCGQHHPDVDELVSVLWRQFCEALRLRALTLDNGKGAE